MLNFVSKANIAASAMIAILTATSPGMAEHAAAEGKSINLVRNGSAPKIDGVLDDPAWKEAAYFDDFHQVDPIYHGEPTERTEVYVLFDDDALYIGVHAFDSEPDKIRATQLAQNKSIRADDMIQVILDPFLNRRTGYSFFINPNGIRREGLYEKPYQMNRDWTGIWYGDARIVEDGWTAEIKIPFKTINFDTSLDEWGFSVSRKIKRKEERVSWTSHNRQSDPSSAGVISGINGVDQGLGLDIIPSVTLKGDYRNDTDDFGFEAVPSMDIFYKLTPSFTTVLTLNTDFSATDVDDRVVDLSRFSVFFPEKRGFFLQDSDIFAFSNIEENGLPFFSRKIGLSEDGEAVDIRAGLKATGRIGRWNLGILDVLQGEQPGVDQSNLLVARASANISKESNAGFILTSGDPQSDNDNMLVGTDLTWRNTSLVGNKALEGTAWYQMTETDGLDGDNQAIGASIGLFARTGFAGEFSYRHIEDNFNPALGFVNRTGIDQFSLWSLYTIRPHGSLIRYVRPSFYFEDVVSTDDELLSRFRSIQPFEIETQAGDKVRLRIKRILERLRSDYEISDGVVIPSGQYVFNRQELWFETTTSRLVSATGTISIGDFFGGHQTALAADVQWRANRHLFLAAGLDHKDIKLPGGDFISRVASFRADVAINSKWAVLSLVQYDNFSDTASLNSRLRWTPEPGKEVFLVVNYGADIDEEGTVRSRETELVLKMSHTFRF